MRKSKLFLLVALLLIVVQVIAACAPAAEPEATAEPAAPETEEAAPPEEEEMEEEEEPAATEEQEALAPIEIEFWTMLGGDLCEKVSEYVEKFNGMQDEVIVTEVNQGGYEPLLEKQLASVAAGNFPPVTLMDYKVVPFFASNGILEPISNWASEEDMQDFIPALLNDLTYDGTVYALPFNRSYQGVYYNKDLFRAAGLDPDSPPETWEEYAEFVDQIGAIGDDVWGSYVYRRSHEHILSFGEPISDANCDVTINSERGVEALQYMADLNFVHGALVPAQLSGPFDQTAIEFIQGKVGMYSGSIAIQNRVKESVDFDWGFSLLPEGPYGDRAWLGGGGNVAMSASADPEIKEAAWKFVSFLSSAEQSADWHMTTGYLPTRYSVANLPEVIEFYEDNPSWQTSVDGAEFIFPTPCAIVNIPQYVSIERPNADRIVLNGEDAQEVMDQLAEELQILIDEKRLEDTLMLPTE